jgi:prepilin-type N-terminal cleavage/methylation domain-containing protein
MKKGLNNKGFTLVELLAVVVILLLLSTVAITSIGASLERQNQKKDAATKEIIISYGRLYLEEYKNNNKACVNVETLKANYNLDSKTLEQSDGNPFDGSVYTDDDYVTFINDWKRNNLIRPDRYHESVYIQLLRDANLVDETATSGKPSDNQLTANCHTSGKPDDNQRETEVRLGKDRKGKDRKVKASTGEEKGILTDSCAEPQGDSTPPVITLLLNTGEEYPIYQKDVDRWSEQFPAVDVMQSLRNMQAWCENNKTKRKTSRGIRRFVTSWLMGDQDKGGNKGGGNKNGNSSQPDTRSTQEDKYADWDFGLVL